MPSQQFSLQAFLDAIRSLRLESQLSLIRLLGHELAKDTRPGQGTTAKPGVAWLEQEAEHLKAHAEADAAPAWSLAAQQSKAAEVEARYPEWGDPQKPSGVPGVGKTSQWAERAPVGVEDEAPSKAKRKAHEVITKKVVTEKSQHPLDRLKPRWKRWLRTRGDVAFRAIQRAPRAHCRPLPKDFPASEDATAMALWMNLVANEAAKRGKAKS